MAYDKKKLAAGVKEMRSVAKRLTTWADDLEKLLTSENSEVNEDAGCSADTPTPPTLAEVKNFLTKLCAAGYAPQVKALIASFGAASLSGVPAESLGDLFDAALLLGEEGGSADAG